MSKSRLWYNLSEAASLVSIVTALLAKHNAHTSGAAYWIGWAILCKLYANQERETLSPSPSPES